MAKKKQNRRARGTGSVFWCEPRQRWVGRVQVGRKANGSPHYVERSAATQGDLLKKLAAAGPPGPDTTVRDWASRWLAESTARPSTRADYQHTLERFVYPTLGHVRVVDLTPHMVESAARRWTVPLPGKRAQGLTANTVRKNLGHLASVMAAAVRANLRPDNPVNLARKPRSKRVQIDPFTPAELSEIVTRASVGPLTRPYALLAVLGCRLGELLALGVEDVKDGTVSIHRTYTRKHGYRPPKSERGIRVLRVAAPALPALVAASWGARPAPCSRPRMERCHDSTRAYNEGGERSWGRLGFRYRNLHQLRHTFASHAMAMGYSPADVARALGDTVLTVLRKYAHPTGADPVAGIERMLIQGGYSGSKVEAPPGVTPKP